MKHLARALDNQNQWWKYLVVFLAAFFASNFIGALPLILVIIFAIMKSGGEISPNPENFMDLSVYGIHPNIALILIIIPFLVGLLTIALLAGPMHKRNLREIINGTNSVRWGRFFYSMIIWIIIMGIYLIIDYFVDPANFHLRLNFSSFIPLIFISIIMIPFQAGYEEVLFRGYLAQGVGAWTKNKWMTILIPGVIFALVHSLNPEIEAFGFWAVMPQYLTFGILFGLITVLDDGIECAMGAHSGNNIFGSVFVTHKASTLQTPALLEQLQVDPLKELGSLLVFSIIFLFILKVKYNWKPSVLNDRIRPLPADTVHTTDQ